MTSDSPKFSFPGRSVISRSVLSIALLLGPAIAAQAADHAIAASAARFDCSRVRPGDTVTIAAGNRGPLKISNCNGSDSNRITIRNDSRGNGPVVIRRESGGSGGFVFTCSNCVGVTIDGSQGWQGAPGGRSYGIKVTLTGGGGPSAFLKIDGVSRFLTIRNVEIDGAWPRLANEGIGISVNDHSVTPATHPGMWREKIIIENSYVHDVEGEGMYVGPNYSLGIPLRDIEIRGNLIEDTGWDAINTKSMWAGENLIHHNVIRRVGTNSGTSTKASQYSGINNDAGTIKIYNNWIEKTGQHGIVQWTSRGPNASAGKGPFDTYIWNNVIVDAGALWRSFMNDAHAINIGAKAGLEEPTAYVFSNTIVSSRQSAIRLASNVRGGYIRDNLIADAKSAPISASSAIDQDNNRIGTISQMSFVDAADLNFRLRPDSPARNQGSDQSPNTDFDDTARPQDGTPDQGAFEYSDGAPQASKPAAPGSLTVE